MDLVLFAFNNGESGDIFVQKAPAADLKLLADTLKKITGVPNHKVENIGTRHGEKLYETLLTNEEMIRSIDMGEFYRIPADTRGLNYKKFFEEGQDYSSNIEEYNSHTTHRLSQKELIDLLLNIREIKDDLNYFNKNE